MYLFVIVNLFAINRIECFIILFLSLINFILLRTLYKPKKGKEMLNESKKDKQKGKK